MKTVAIQINAIEQFSDSFRGAFCQLCYIIQLVPTYKSLVCEKRWQNYSALMKKKDFKSSNSAWYLISGSCVSSQYFLQW